MKVLIISVILLSSVLLSNNKIIDINISTIILISLIAITLCWHDVHHDVHHGEHLTDLEAISSLAQTYNTGNAILTNLTVTGNANLGPTTLSNLTASGTTNVTGQINQTGGYTVNGPLQVIEGQGISLGKGGSDIRPVPATAHQWSLDHGTGTDNSLKVTECWNDNGWKCAEKIKINPDNGDITLTGNVNIVGNLITSGSTTTGNLTASGTTTTGIITAPNKRLLLDASTKITGLLGVNTNRVNVVDNDYIRVYKGDNQPSWYQYVAKNSAWSEKNLPGVSNLFPF
jgi:hypothetical protein